MLAMLVLLSTLLANIPLAQAPTDQPSAKISFDLSACGYIVKANAAIAAVQYTFGPAEGNGRADTTSWDAAIRGNFRWVHPAHSRLHFDVVLPQGFYQYTIVADSPGYQFACEQQWYLAVLPDRDQTITDEMLNGIGDPVTQLLFAGTLSDGITAIPVRYDGAPPCGAPTESLRSYALRKVSQSAGAYYAFDDALTAKENRAATFGLELSWPNGEHRTVRIDAEYPDEIISGAPTFARFDVTPALGSALLAKPAGELICAGSH